MKDCMTDIKWFGEVQPLKHAFYPFQVLLTSMSICTQDEFCLLHANASFLIYMGSHLLLNLECGRSPSCKASGTPSETWDFLFELRSLMYLLLILHAKCLWNEFDSFGEFSAGSESPSFVVPLRVCSIYSCSRVQRRYFPLSFSLALSFCNFIATAPVMETSHAWRCTMVI